MHDAKNYLLQIEFIDRKIQNKLIEREQWHSIATGITANLGGEKVQATSTNQKMANAVIKCVDIENEVDKLIDELISTKINVIHTIEQLESPIEYDVLHRRYIQYQTLNDISLHYHKEYTWATTVHGRALKNVQKILENQNL